MYQDKWHNNKPCCENKCNHGKDWCKPDNKCCKKSYVKVFVECGKECVCLCGILLGSYCECPNKKIMVIKDKCGKKIFINHDQISYWKVCDGWY